jgi:signal-transduction protein with cAMP-binding, CBS, and nucleotidyltransferase domain
MAELMSVGSMTVADLVAEGVARTTTQATITDLTRMLTEEEVGVLAVFDGDELFGVVSERDVVHAVAAGLDPATTTVGAIAHRTLVWCDASATVAEVATEMMARYVRHVLVEEDGRLVAIVSARDLLGAYAAGDMTFDG